MGGGRVLRDLRAAGLRVAARKPAQSFDPDDPPSGRDAAVLGAATGEAPEEVCPPHRWYEIAMAPPMAAGDAGSTRRSPSPTSSPNCAGRRRERGGSGRRWTGRDRRRRALAHGEDGDVVALCEALAPDVIVLVADAGLGTINAVRLTTHALGTVGTPPVVVLNRFDESIDLHGRNRSWLRSLDLRPVVTIPEDGYELASFVAG